jgi:hypothetical protein
MAFHAMLFKNGSDVGLEKAIRLNVGSFLAIPWNVEAD